MNPQIGGGIDLPQQIVIQNPLPPEGAVSLTLLVAIIGSVVIPAAGLALKWYLHRRALRAPSREAAQDIKRRNNK